MTPEFFLTSLIVVLIPGTGVMFTLAVGLGRGFWASVAAALGCTFGILPAAMASIVGLASILHASAQAFLVIKYLGVLYLFYMAWKILRNSGEASMDRDAGPPQFRRIVITGFLINVLNPKLSLFFLAFLPQFIAPGDGAGALIALALAFMAMTFVVFVIYGAFAARARDYVIDRPLVMARIRQVFAGTFAALGLRLALPE